MPYNSFMSWVNRGQLNCENWSESIGTEFYLDVDRSVKMNWVDLVCISEAI